MAVVLSAAAPVAIVTARTAPEGLEETRRPPAATLADAYGQMPLAFEVNRGQVNPAVRYLARTPSSTVYLTPTEAVIDFDGNALRMRFADANPAPALEGIDSLLARSNYFVGDEPGRWQAGLPNFGKVAYRGVYPGIDVVYYGNQQELEYDMVVAPRADPTVISLRFSGAESMRLDGQELVLSVGKQEVRQRPPVVYQEYDGRRTFVDAHYEVTNETVAFQLGSYDRTRELVIDPVVYSKLVGGHGNPGGFSADSGHDIAVDSAGNVYVAGVTQTSDFPTVNPQDVFGSGEAEAAFVLKLDPTGTTLLYSTVLRASMDEGIQLPFDKAYAIALDSLGGAYVTGRTGGVDFPTTPGAFHGPESVIGQGNSTGGSTTYTTNSPVFSPEDRFRLITGPNIPAQTRIATVNSATAVELERTATATGAGLNFTLFPRSADAFVTKLDPNGNLVYSTYLGIFGANEGRGIAVDGMGRAHVAGTTNDLLVEDADQFAVKLNATGTGVVYSKIIGGLFGLDLTLDSSGNACVLGWSVGGFPVTAGAYASTVAGPDDWTLTRLDANGNVNYASYVGGSGSESWSDLTNDRPGIAVDASNRVYIGGSTASTDFPGTSGRFQPTHAGGVGPNPLDVVVAKFDLSLAPASQLVWATYLGGSNNDYASSSPHVDSGGSVYVAGTTHSTDFPLASSVPVTTPPGTRRGFVTRLNQSATGLVWSTYLGGGGGAFATGIAGDSAGSTYVTGGASSNFVAPPGAPPPLTNGGTPDAFVVKLSRAAFPRVADFNADGRSDVSVFRPSSSLWFVQGGLSLAWGTSGDVPVPNDYDGDGDADVAVYRPSNGLWFIHGGATAAWGAPGDVPVPGDYDGDGDADIVVFRPSVGTWFVQGGTTAAWGTSGDIPVPGDYDGDGDTDMAVFRPSTGSWYVQGIVSLTWGTNGDVPVPGDYDGDNRTDIAVYRPSTGTWFVRGGVTVTWGTSGDVPVPGDYDRNGTTEVAVFRPSTGIWFVRAGVTAAWGASGDIALPLGPAIRQALFP